MLFDDIVDLVRRAAAARDSSRPCRVYTAASLNFLPGIATLLSSFTAHGGLACTVVLLHHGDVPDSQLSAHNMSYLGCAAHPLRIARQKVDDRRMRLFSSFASAHYSSAHALMKLELLFAAEPTSNDSALRIWMDGDMLVRRPLWPLETVSSSRWRLHVSTPAGGRNINSGFFALPGPAPASAQEVLTAGLHSQAPLPSGCRPATGPNQTRVTQCDDQAVLRFFVASKLRAVVSHDDWRMNYQPRDSWELGGWRAAHWMGTRKPWGGCGPFVCKQQLGDSTVVQDRLEDEWRQEWRGVQARCSLAAHREVS